MTLKQKQALLAYLGYPITIFNQKPWMAIV